MKKIIAIQLDKENGKTTLVTEAPTVEAIMATTESGKQVPVGVNFTKKKEVLTTQAVGEDEYDPYIGVALLLAYTYYGGKKKFRNFVDKKAKVVRGKKKSK